MMLLEIDPNNLNALVGKGISLSLLGRHKEVPQCYGDALKIDPNSLSLLLDKGFNLFNAWRNSEDCNALMMH